MAPRSRVLTSSALFCRLEASILRIRLKVTPTRFLVSGMANSVKPQSKGLAFSSPRFGRTATISPALVAGARMNICGRTYEHTQRFHARFLRGDSRSMSLC